MVRRSCFRRNRNKACAINMQARSTKEAAVLMPHHRSDFIFDLERLGRRETSTWVHGNLQQSG